MHALRKSNRNHARTSTQRLDALGIGASTLCLVHCLAFPLVLACVPLFGPSAATTSDGCVGSPLDFWFHVVLLTAVIPVGVAAWISGYLRHKDGGVVLLGLVGVALLVAALVFGHHWMDGQGERVLTIAGSIAMVSAHLLNRRQCHCPPSRFTRDPLALSSCRTEV
jgi:hypothetical protein